MSLDATILSWFAMPGMLNRSYAQQERFGVKHRFGTTNEHAGLSKLLLRPERAPPVLSKRNEDAASACFTDQTGAHLDLLEHVASLEREVREVARVQADPDRPAASARERQDDGGENGAERNTRAARNASRGASRGVLRGVSRVASRGVSRGVARGVARGVSRGVSRGASRGVSRGAARGRT